MYKKRVGAEELLVVEKMKCNLDVAGVEEVGLSYEERHVRELVKSSNSSWLMTRCT
jgi:transposase